MNFTKVILWSFGIIMLFATVHNLDEKHVAILKAQASLISESRTATWGKPKLFTPGKKSM